MTMTPELRQALEHSGGQPVEIQDPQTSTRYVLVRADLFREMHELFVDEQQRAAIARKALRNAGARVDEP